MRCSACQLGADGMLSLGGLIYVQGTGVSVAHLMEAIHAAAQAAGQAIEAQKALVSQTGNSKVPMPMRGLPDPAALTRIAAVSQHQIEGALGDDTLGCSQRSRLLEAAKAEAMETLRSAGAVRSEASSVSPTPFTSHANLLACSSMAAASAGLSCLEKAGHHCGVSRSRPCLRQCSRLLSAPHQAAIQLPSTSSHCQKGAEPLACMHSAWSYGAAADSSSGVSASARSTSSLHSSGVHSNWVRAGEDKAPAASSMLCLRRDYAHQDLAWWPPQTWTTPGPCCSEVHWRRWFSTIICGQEGGAWQTSGLPPVR